MTEPRKDDLISVDRAFQVAWIVYVNGVEVPAVSATVSYGVGASDGSGAVPEAEIALVPDPLLQRLGAEDRVTVQIFYCDYWMNPQGPPQFRLLFDGEIMSWSYVNVSAGRALAFHCGDYIRIWTQLFFFFMSSLNDMATGASRDQMGMSINSVVTSGFAPIYPYSLFAQGILPITSETETPDGEQGSTEGSSDGAEDQAATSSSVITRPIDFVYNIVRALIDINLPNRTTPAANFFSPWTRRTNFHKRFVALPYLEDSTNPGVFPILRAVQAESAVDAVARLASRIGPASSVYGMITEILQTLMMELSMLPTAPAVCGNYQSLNISGIAPKNSTTGNPIFLANYFVKPQFMFGLPPTCNVFFPGQIQHYAYQENFDQQPTRLYFSEETLQGLLNVDSNAGSTMSGLMRDALSVAYPEEADTAMRLAHNGININAKDMLIYPEEFFKGPVLDRRPLPTWFSFLENARGQNPQTGEEPAPVETSPAVDGSTDVGTPGSTAGNAPTTMGQIQAEVTIADRLGISVEVIRAIRNPENASGISATSNTVRFEVNKFLQRRPDYRDTLPYTPQGAPGSISRVSSETNRAAFDRAYRLDASNAITCSSWGQYQVLGNTLLALYPDPAAAVAAYDANPTDVGARMFERYMGVERPAVLRAARALSEAIRAGSPDAVLRQRCDELSLVYNPRVYDGAAHINPPWSGAVFSSIKRQQGGPAGGSPTPSETPVDPTTEETTQPASDVVPGDTDRDLFRLYAKYEFFKERYKCRQGGLRLAFNPYPVPGFPCAVFDRRSTQVDTFGYVMNVQHQLRSDGWDTSLSFTHGRTFQEMFALLQRQFAFENTILLSQTAEIEQLVAGRGGDAVDSREVSQQVIQPVGAIAMGPPEPLAEIRDVIQSFTRAEAFYRSLFFREASPASEDLTLEQARGSVNRLGTAPKDTPKRTAAGQQILNSDPVEPFQQSIGYEDAVAATTDQTRQAPAAEAPTYTPGVLLNRVGDIPPTKRASFYYPEIIYFKDTLTGTTTDIILEGVDATARNQALDALDRLRNNDTSMQKADIALVCSVASVQTVPVPYTEALAGTYNNIEVRIRTRGTTTNVSGEYEIAPRPEALHLFDSYENAMQYNARPICTLDEYIAFLGDQGMRVAQIDPDSARVANDSRLFPATYYVQIRQYRNGPPPQIPTVNITNTQTISGVDGLTSTDTPSSTEDTDTPTDHPVVSGLPDNFPETRANWTALLLAYRQRALTNLPPRT